MIYDAHCHLDLMDNMLEFINEIQNSDMNLFAVGTTPKAYSREIQFCKNEIEKELKRTMSSNTCYSLS